MPARTYVNIAENGLRKESKIQKEDAGSSLKVMMKSYDFYFYDFMRHGSHEKCSPFSAASAPICGR